MDRARPIAKLLQSGVLRPINPMDVLKQFGPLPVGADLKTEGLRDRTKERCREIVDGCLFCYGWSRRIGKPVWVLDHRAVDYDVIALYENNDGGNDFAPIQLKEVPPQRLNPKASLQSEIDKLAKYSGDDLTVAIRVNQQTEVSTLDEIIMPPSLRIAGLWIYGAVSPDGSRWFLAGNLLKRQPILMTFDYPT
jgi:hypothetical protein